MIREPQKTILYNEPYVPVANEKHPSLMGSTMARAWSEILESLEPAFAHAASLRRATNMEDSPFFLRRRGYLEETFFSFSLIPICDQFDTVHGFYNTAFETTRQKIWERRTSTYCSTHFS